MQILEGPEVDLISPFPHNQIHRVWGWMQCFRSLHLSDNGPKTKEEFEQIIQDYLNTMATFGVIDKFNKLGLSHPAPLVGLLLLDNEGKENRYLHFASTRSAWGTGIMDQALQVLLEETFKNSPLRISAMILNKNKAAKAFLCRNHFKPEGLLRSMVMQASQPQDIVHLGVLRSDWQFTPQAIHTRS